MWQGFEYARVTLGSKYTIWLNMSEDDVNMVEYVCILDNRQDSVYASYNLQREVTPQVNEYLLRDMNFQSLAKDLRWSALKKKIMFFTIFAFLRKTPS